MHLIKFFKKLIMLCPKPVVHSLSKKDEIVDRIVRDYALGSVSLHRGKYITSDMIKERKKELSVFNFFPKSH